MKLTIDFRTVISLVSGATSRGGLPVVQHRVTRLAVVTFLHVNRTQKLPRGKSNLAHAYY